MSSESKKVLISPIVDNNPIALQVLGICSALSGNKLNDECLSNDFSGCFCNGIF